MSFTSVHPRVWLSEQDCDLDAFRALVERATDPADYPHASAVERNVPVYDAGLLEGDRVVQAELVRALAEQRASGATAGDHFAKPGANDRVWNALEKAALYDAEAFADYYANDVLALVATAWLGPGYQVTSQLNVVNPGGAAQTAHRDYHLGFLSDEAAAAYPGHVHRLSPVLTLQGAVAHCDMPVESGPTMYLPHSQKYEPGYLAWRRPEFRAYFEAHQVQLPLAKGDAVFFNPALFHAAGTNRSADIRRMANLLQVSSAFGRAMETVDREAVANAVYPVLLKRKAEGASDAWLANVIAASAEGYPFPTNLDSDPPVDGLAPPSQADLVRRALYEGWPPEALRAELRAGTARRES
ncbi:phytanoyl-CoA dioxygenase family protein [Streptomyces coeruleorubidus]|uniref:Phytanoyl-CoA dioxygenase family protein n=1 Tax=Streptomyces coeruleorubidus TaxID=116188 RepID=A0ABZ0K413_STRC4|nr:phytanoyl-CoA dioxygenase family protein [Streptomyces coeruleorubidus]WOT32787.1 phytanoyl-CoA dioxygenase family protein [Streptomyces coeruleorubidus]